MVSFQDSIAYRASGLIWVLGDAIAAVSMPLIWRAVFVHTGKPVGGYSVSSMTVYYLAFLLIQSFVTCHMMWDIATAIKEGKFTPNLTRPIAYSWYALLTNLSWRVIRPLLFLPFFLVILAGFYNMIQGAHLFLSLPFFLSLVGGHLLSFALCMMLSPLAFFTTEVYSIFELYYVPMFFLSGQLFPIEVFPAWCQKLSSALPFYYTSGLPTEILIGRVSFAHSWSLILVQLTWLAGAAMLAHFAWKFGLRRYTAIGL